MARMQRSSESGRRLVGLPRHRDAAAVAAGVVPV